MYVLIRSQLVYIYCVVTRMFTVVGCDTNSTLIACVEKTFLTKLKEKEGVEREIIEIGSVTQYWRLYQKYIPGLS